MRKMFILPSVSSPLNALRQPNAPLSFGFCSRCQFAAVGRGKHKYHIYWQHSTILYPVTHTHPVARERLRRRERRRLVRVISSPWQDKRDGVLTLADRMLPGCCWAVAAALFASTATPAVESQLFEIRKHSSGDTKAQGSVGGSGNGSGFS